MYAYGSLVPLLSLANRSAHPTTCTRRMIAGCSPGVGAEASWVTFVCLMLRLLFTGLGVTRLMVLRTLDMMGMCPTCYGSPDGFYRKRGFWAGAVSMTTTTPTNRRKRPISALFPILGKASEQQHRHVQRAIPLSTSGEFFMLHLSISLSTEQSSRSIRIVMLCALASESGNANPTAVDSGRPCREHRGYASRRPSRKQMGLESS